MDDNDFFAVSVVVAVHCSECCCTVTTMTLISEFEYLMMRWIPGHYEELYTPVIFDSLLLRNSYSDLNFE